MNYSSKSILRHFKTAATCGLLSLALASQAAAAEVIRLNSVTPNDPKNVDNQKLADIARRLKEKTNGELELEINYSSSLVPQTQEFEAVTQGIIDAYFDSPNHSAGYIPEADLFSLPLNFKDHADFVAKTRGCIDPLLSELYAAKGAQYLGSLPGSGVAIIMSKDEVKSVADLSGKKIRVFGPAQADLMQEVGASGVYVAFTELEVALNRGVADGYMTGWGNVAQIPGLRKESKYIIWPPLQGSLATTIVMNKAKFDALSPELQTALTEAVDETIRAGVDFMNAEDAKAKAAIEQFGIEFTEFSAEEQAKLAAAGEKVWQIWADKVVAAGGDEARARVEKIVTTLRDGCSN